MFLERIQLLSELNELSVFFRIVLSMVLGGILGIEREQKRRPAGFRTYVIVCLGSTLVMMTNQFLYLKMESPDSTRIAAQVISGIGFLGAGTILVTKNNQVKGLTTAAGLWAAAALGLAVGCGFYSGALISFLAIFCSVQILHTIDSRIYRRSKVFTIYAELEQVKHASKIFKYARDHKMELSDIEITKQKQVENNIICLTGTIRLQKSREHYEVIQEFSQLSGVTYIEEIK
jgi:putative Mg2+ transporter-C (MgtC) family protein